MLEKIKEESIWKRLTETKLPIVLYGMGNGADMIIDVLDSLGVGFSDIFASDEFVRGHSFHGKKVLRYSQICEKYDDFIILMTFAVRDEGTLERVRKMNEEHELLAPTVPIAGKGLFTLGFVSEHEREFDEAYEMLADEKSRKAFIDVLNFKISGKIGYLFDCLTEKSEVYEQILKLTENEIIADLGAYDGDTIREFLEHTNGKYKKIYAFEPDGKNFKKLKEKTEGKENIVYLNAAAWDKDETLFFENKAGRNSRQGASGVQVRAAALDSVTDEVTFIKMDVEGAEAKALMGAENLIKRCRPKLYVCAYHRNEDAFYLPKMIKSFCPDYEIYYRHHPYIPAWESNFYCVCKDGNADE
ncbi:MAG: FkbM family methyltransferase [Oscillospiraceae bacterium]|nr:FkbM family methyltransferase [Oscillospiraceae bacterium]